MKKKNKNQSRTKFKRVEIHFTEAEVALVKEMAGSAHVSVAAYIRSTALAKARATTTLNQIRLGSSPKQPTGPTI
jgi:hypothetical protein